MFSMKTLKRVAIYGGVIAISGGVYFQTKIQANFRKQPYYLQTLELVKGYQPARGLLGEPMSPGRLDLGNTSNNYTDGLNAKLAIPLKGPRGLATFHSWATRTQLGDEWTIQKMDMEMKGKWWTVYLNPGGDKIFKATLQDSEGNVYIEGEIPSSCEGSHTDDGRTESDNNVEDSIENSSVVKSSSQLSSRISRPTLSNF